MHQLNLKTRQSIAVLMVVYALFGCAQAFGEYRVLFLESQGLTATECGRVLAAASLLSAIARPLAGALADKLRSRRIVYIGAVLSWLTLLALMLLTQHIRLAGFTLCAGVIPFLSVSEPVTYGMIEAGGVHAALLEPKLDFSLIRVCLSIGYSVINFLYTPIVSRFGPIAPFACTMVYLVVLLALSGSLRKFESVPSNGCSRASFDEKLGIVRLFKNYYLVTFVLLSFVMALGSQTFYFLLYLIEALEMDASLVGTATGIRVLGEIIIMPLVPYIKRKVSLPMLQAIAGMFCMLQMVLFLTCKNPYVTLGAVMLSGFSTGITLSTSAVYLRLMAPAGLDTTTLSLSTAMSSLGIVAMSLVGGIVVDTLGIFVLYRIALCILLLWLILYFSTWAFGRYVLHKTPPVPMFPAKPIRDT